MHPRIDFHRIDGIISPGVARHMNRVFASGGTGGQIRLVAHTEVEWKGIVVDTALVMRTYGVSSGSRVLIGQPSFPWSIGQAFADAAISCGADAVCLGSHVAHFGLAKKALEMGPDVLIVPPRLLLLWTRAGIQPLPSVGIVVVGEPLPSWLEAQLVASWRPRWVRRIYGHSELGTLAYQATDHSAFLQVNPRFDFAIHPLKESEVRIPGAAGRLVVTSLDSGLVVDTCDVARVLEGCTGSTPWAGCHLLQVVGRVFPTLYLADGTAIEVKFLEELQRQWNLGAVQLVHSPANGTHQKISIFLVASRSVDLDGFRTAVLETAPELRRLGLSADGWDVPEVEVRQVAFDDLRTTSRGKIPLMIDECSHPESKLELVQ